MGSNPTETLKPTGPDHQEESATKPRPAILYKYMGGKFGIEVFTKARIKYTQPDELNDPFECKPHLPGPVDPETSERIKIERNINGIFRQAVQQAANRGNRKERRRKNRRASIRKMEKNLNDIFDRRMANLAEERRSYIRKEFATYRNEIAMLCLTQSRANLLMWSHYADQHAGFVIGVDTAHPCVSRRRSETDDYNYFQPVTYSETRPSFYVSQLTSREPVILTKSKEWCYEEEWRVVSPLELLTKDPTNGKYFHYLPIDAIREVYMGARISPKLRERIIRELLKRQDQHAIRLFQMNENEHRYALDETEVLYPDMKLKDEGGVKGWGVGWL